MQNTLSNTQKFESFKKEVQRGKMVKSKIFLSDIKIMSDEYIEFQGVSIAIAPEAFKDIIRILGLNKKILSNFSEYMSEKAKLGLIRAMQKGISSSGKAYVYLHVTRDKVVQRITLKKGFGVTNDAYLDIIERAINDNPDLEINSYAVDTKGLHMNMTNNSQVIDIPNMPDESFHFGMSIDNNFSLGTLVSPFNERLICENGLITTMNGTAETLKMDNPGTFSMKERTAGKWNEFFDHIDELKKNNYVPAQFVNKVKTADETYASVAELEKARSIMRSNSNLDTDVELWVPAENMRMKYQSKGVDLTEQTFDKLKTANSGVKMWDLINRMTDFASHNYNYEITNTGRKNIKESAGKMLYRKEFDMNSIMTVNPFN